MASGRNKRDPYKFNIRFSPDNPMEVVAANFLNSVGAKAKAPYIAQLIAKELAAAGMLQTFQNMPAPEMGAGGFSRMQNPVLKSRRTVGNGDGVTTVQTQKTKQMTDDQDVARVNSDVSRAASIMSALPAFLDDEDEEDEGGEADG